MFKVVTTLDDKKKMLVNTNLVLTVDKTDAQQTRLMFSSGERLLVEESLEYFCLDLTGTTIYKEDGTDYKYFTV